MDQSSGLPDTQEYRHSLKYWHKFGWYCMRLLGLPAFSGLGPLFRPNVADVALIAVAQELANALTGLPAFKADEGDDVHVVEALIRVWPRNGVTAS